MKNSNGVSVDGKIIDKYMVFIWDCRNNGYSPQMITKHSVSSHYSQIMRRKNLIDSIEPPTRQGIVECIIEGRQYQIELSEQKKNDAEAHKRKKMDRKNARARERRKEKREAAEALKHVPELPVEPIPEHASHTRKGKPRQRKTSRESQEEINIRMAKVRATRKKDTPKPEKKPRKSGDRMKENIKKMNWLKERDRREKAQEKQTKEFMKAERKKQKAERKKEREQTQAQEPRRTEFDARHTLTPLEQGKQFAREVRDEWFAAGKMAAEKEINAHLEKTYSKIEAENTYEEGETTFSLLWGLIKFRKSHKSN